MTDFQQETAERIARLHQEVPGEPFEVSLSDAIHMLIEAMQAQESECLKGDMISLSTHRSKLQEARRQRDEALALLRMEREKHGAALYRGNKSQCSCEWCKAVDALLDTGQPGDQRDR